MPFVSKRALLTQPMMAALVLATSATHAAGPEVTPNAGSILQQLKPAVPPAPQPNAPSLRVEPRATGGLPPSQPIPVKRLRITGNTAFSAEVLHALVADQEGQALTLPQLEELAGRITTHYQGHGFQLTRAIIPAQSITDGVIVIQVVEARFGQVRLHNRSEVQDDLLQATLAPLAKGQLISDAELNRALLLLSDVPGVGVNATLKPGDEVGTSDMDVDARHNRMSWGSVSLDNYGSRYIGRARLSGNLSAINLLRHGDILSVNAVSTGEGMTYGRLAYDILLNGLGTRIGGAYSAVHYRLGSTVDALGANGTAGVASMWAKHPVLRTPQFNVYGQLQFDAKKLRDHLDASSIRTDRRLDNLVLSVNGDLRDDLLAGGMSMASFAWTSGRVGFDDAAAAADAAAARTRGSFAKWNATLTRLQGLTAQDSLYFSFGAQWADGNLDSAEKMAAGGPYSVRAYDSGAISGDTGYGVTLEVRHDLGPVLAGRWQAVAFADSSHVKLNRHPWSVTDNSATLSGVGFGLNWSGLDQWRASATVASRVGAVPSLLGKPASVRAWVVASKGF